MMYFYFAFDCSQFNCFKSFIFKKDFSVKNKIFHTQDLCLHTNLRCAKNSARKEITMNFYDYEAEDARCNVVKMDDYKGEGRSCCKHGYPLLIYPVVR